MVKCTRPACHVVGLHHRVCAPSSDGLMTYNLLDVDDVDVLPITKSPSLSVPVEAVVAAEPLIASPF